MKFHIAVLVFLVGGALAKNIPFTFQRLDDECTPLTGNEATCSSYWSGGKPPLLVISLDGFRPDYLERTIDGQPAAPFIKRLIDCGLSAKSGMTPVFPSLTFPNHYSIVTGLYPESHGIVANSFFDPDLNASFYLSSPQQTNPVWWIGEPLWYTAKRQGKISATYFWPGSDQSDPVREPNYWLLYDGSVPYRERMEQIFAWLSLPVGQRPNFLTLYLDEPDHTAHGDSPDSPTVAEQIKRVDAEVEFLFTAMEQSGIIGCVDVIVLSDHGMANSPPGEKFVVLNNYVLDIVKSARIYDGVFPTIRPYLDTQAEEDRIATGLQCQEPNMRVFNKWDFPKRHHYAKTNRVPSILADMTVGWRAFDDSEWILPGNHGWDNLNTEMQATFIAVGPSFKTKTQVRPFHNIDLYNLMCAMIGVEPAPNNGTWGALYHMLSNPPALPEIDPADDLPEMGFPVDAATYEQNLKRSKCDLITGENNADIDMALNLTLSDIENAHSLHIPWGQPQPSNNSDTFTLTNRDYVTAFNIANGIPLWISYTLQQPVEMASGISWRLDPRLEENDKSICDRFDPTFIAAPLMPFGSLNDISTDTNAIDVSSAFVKYWNGLHLLIEGLTKVNKTLNVIVGPVRGSSPSPSVFAIVSSCNDATVSLDKCPVVSLDFQSFILPTNARYSKSCLDIDVFLRAHVATLRDVENLTNIKFFPLLTYGDKADLLSRTPLATMLLLNPDPSP